MRAAPYAPFRSGPPRLQVALTPIALDDWLQPDIEAATLDARRHWLDRPETFYRRGARLAYSETEAARLVLGASGSPPPDRKLCLIDAARQVSDDLVVLDRVDEVWTVTSLILTSPTFFSVDQAFGAGLGVLHGPVPGGDKLSHRIARIFDHLQPDTVLERFNWTLQPGADRFTPDSAPLIERAKCAGPADAARLLHLRVERQTIRRLPGSGGVLFTIRVSIDPVAAIASSDRAALASAWRGISEQGHRYKRWDAIDPLAKTLFAEWGV
jgi:dimethylamine monooxygenase subunit A